LIKINLAREGRAVRGAGAPAAAAAIPGGGGAPGNMNNVLAAGLSILGIVLAAGYWFYTNRQFADAEERKATREAEAQKLEKVIKDVEDFQRQKDNLQKRIDLINQLKQNQKGPVRIMDQISRDLPDLVWLDKMDMKGARVTINGRGLNPNAIALFVQNVKNDPYFEEPNVGTVTQASIVPLVYTFDMDFGFTYTPKNAAPPPGAPGSTTTSTAGTAGTTTTTGTAKK
jgi:type IV pilus assembly protein PilN